jgi:hypothetical protein
MIAIALAAAMTSCAGSKQASRVADASTPPPPQPRSASTSGRTTVHVLADNRAALIRPPGPESGPWPASVAVQLDSAAPQQTPVWWLAPVPAAVTDPTRELVTADRMRHWLGDNSVWAAAPINPANPPAPPGLPLIALPPEVGIANPAVRIDGVHPDLLWLAPQSGQFNFAAPHTSPDLHANWLTAALALSIGQPWVFWRAELGHPDFKRELRALPPADSLAVRLAEQRSGVWAVALQRLARADRDTARRLAIRLGGVIDFGAGIAAPIWLGWPGPRTPDDGLRLLLADLLASDLTDRERAERAAAWLDSLPAGAAWVLDDAGLRDAAAKANVATVMMVNLTDAPAVASVTIDSAAAPAEMLTLRPMSATRIRVPMRAGEARSAARRLTFHIGPWRGHATVLGDAVPARPPGITIGPLQRDITMPVILASADTGQMPLVTPDPDGLTAGLLTRAAADSTAARAGSWTVYLECLRPALADPASTSRDVVFIHFGPPNAPVATWRIDASGKSALSSPSRSITAGEVTFTSESDRYLLWAPVPAAAIEPDGRLRIGIVRERLLADGSFERTAWPRAMLPWQTDSARLTIDLGAWDRAGSPR